MTDLVLTMPRLGETMEEGTIAAWLVAPGAAFRRGEAILELETDKTVSKSSGLSVRRSITVTSTPLVARVAAAASAWWTCRE